MSLVRNIQPQQQQQQQQQQGDLSWVLESSWNGSKAPVQRSNHGFFQDYNNLLNSSSSDHEVAAAKSYITPSSSWVLLGNNNNSSTSSYISSSRPSSSLSSCYDHSLSSIKNMLSIPSTTSSSGSSFLGSFEPPSSLQSFPGVLSCTPHHHHLTEVLSSSNKRDINMLAAAAAASYAGDYNTGLRIGLDLGGRTYFSTAEDMLAVRLNLAKRHHRSNCSSAVPAPLCQAQGCRADLSTAKHYHRRHKVCEMHSKASTVTANGQTQRFCQQCSRFHALCEFDEGKRSCRKRLADHNRRRRKPQQSNNAAVVLADHPEDSTSAKDPDVAAEDNNAANNSFNNVNNSTESSSNPHGSVKPDALAAVSRSGLRPQQASSSS